MKKHLLKSLLALTLVLISGNAWGTDYTLGWGTATGTTGTFTNFTAASGSVGGVLSFTTAKNKSTSNPAYNSSNKDLRLYYDSDGNGNGGSITLTPFSGITITGAVITSTTAPSVAYKVNGGAATSVTASSNTYTISGISATSSLEIQNVNTTNTQLRIKTIVVSYQSSSAVTVSFDASKAVVALGGTYTQIPITHNTGGAAVVYSTSNADIATVNASTGEVTGVAEGSATITATVNVGGNNYSGEYIVEVYEVKDGEFDFTVGYDFRSGLTPSTSQTSEEKTFTAGSVKAVASGAYAWYNSNDEFDLRIYAGGQLVVTPPTGKVIKKIEFTGASMTQGSIQGTPFENGTTNTWVGQSDAVTITRSGSSTVRIKTMVVTYGDQASVASASIDNTDINVGETATITPNPAGLAVTYSSNHTAIATVSDAGVVTGVGHGTATITASWNEQLVGATTYAGGSATFDVTVTDPSIVTIWSENWSGASADAVPTAGVSGTNNDKAAYTLTNGGSDTKIFTAALAGGTSPELLIGKSTGSWKITLSSLADCSGTLILSMKINNKVTVTSSVGTVSNSGNLSSSGTLNITKVPKGTSSIEITIAAGSSNVRIDDVELLGKVETTAAVYVSSYQWATASFSYPVVVPAANTVYAVTGVEGSTLTLNALAAGTVIGKDTGVLVYKETEGDVEFTYTNQSADGFTTILRTSGAVSTTDSILGTYDGGFGFCHPSADITCTPGKAFLPGSFVTTSTPAPFLRIGGTTHVDNLERNAESAVYFDLLGRKVAQPERGIYILNGKKVLVQ